MGLTYIGSNENGQNFISYNHGSFTTQAGLLIVVALGGSSAARTLVSVSIGGTNGDVRATSGSNLTVCGIVTREVGAGSHNVTTTWSATMQHAAVAVYLLTGYASQVPDHSAGQNGTGTSAALTLDFPSNGVAVYGAIHSNVNGTTWSAATEDGSGVLEIARQYSTSRKIASGAGNTETASWSGSTDFSAAAAVWRPGGAPLPVVMHHLRTQGIA